MIERVHYENNIFFIETMIKSLEQGLHQSVDASFFQNKVIEDIFFIDSILLKLYQTLKNQVHLLSRNEQLKLLIRAKNNYIHFIQNILNRKIGVTLSLEPIFTKLRTILNSHKNNVQQMLELLTVQQPKTEETNQISQEEFKHLFSDSET